MQAIQFHPLQRQQELLPRTLPHSSFQGQHEIPPCNTPTRKTRVASRINQVRPITQVPRSRQELPPLLHVPTKQATQRKRRQNTWGLNIRSTHTPRPQQAIRNSYQESNLRLLRIKFSNQENQHVTHQNIKSSPRTRQPTLLLRRRAREPPSTNPTTQLKQQLQRSSHKLRHQRSNNNQPPTSTITKDTPTPRTSHLHATTQATQRHTVPRLQSQKNLHKQQVKRQHPSIQLQLNTFSPPTISQYKRSLLLPPSKHATCRGQPTMPRPPPIPTHTNPRNKGELRNGAVTTPISQDNLLGAATYSTIEHYSQPTTGPTNVHTQPAPYQTCGTQAYYPQQPHVQ